MYHLSFDNRKVLHILYGQVMKLLGGNGACQLVGSLVGRFASDSLGFCAGMPMIFLDLASCNYLLPGKQRHCLLCRALAARK